MKPLSIAAREGDLCKVKALLRKYDDYDAVNHALCSAAGGNHVEIIKYLIEKSDEYYYDSDVYDEILMCAVRCGSLEALKYLFVEFDTIECLDYQCLGEQLMEIAARYNQLEIFKYLVEDCGVNDEQLLHKFMRYGHLKIIKYLLEERGLDIDDCYLDSGKIKTLETIKYLLEERGLDIDKHMFDCGSVNSPEVVKYLIEKYGTEARNKFKANYRPKVVRYLIEKQNFDVSYARKEILYKAVMYRKPKTVKYLVENGVDVHNFPSKDLRYATGYRHIEVKLILCNY